MEKEKYYLFGAGNNAWGVIAYFGKENIIAIIDNEGKKVNDRIQNIPIISFSQYLQLRKEETVIITAAVYNDIELQLRSQGIMDYYIAPMIQMGLASTEQMITDWRLTEMDEIFLIGYDPIGRKLKNELSRHSAKCSVRVIPRNDRERKWAERDKVSTAEETEIGTLANVILFHAEDYDRIRNKKGTDQGIFNIFDLQTRSNRELSVRLSRWKNAHNRESCFLIGNGPSLKMEDLEKIRQSEIDSFGMNLIYKVYANTSWRPSYYIFSDYNMMRQYYDEIAQLRQDNLFVKNFYYMDETPVLPEASYYPGYADRCYLEKQRFSDDIAKAVYGGYTVMYDALQIAIYMGYQKIYIIGADFSYLEDPAGKGNHFYDDKVEDRRSVAGKPHIYITLEAMQKAEEYAREHGIEIYNATRGGKLETFRRVDLDSVFQGF